MSANKLTALVIEKNFITDRLMVVKIKPNSQFVYRPGQYCTVGINGSERPYSIVSAPHEEYIELFVELVRDGTLTPELWKVNSGDIISMSPMAKGMFTFENDYDNHLMIATVTGIAPILSMIRDSLHNGLHPHRFYVVHGASFEKELAYRIEMENLSMIHDDIYYIPTVSRPHDPENCRWEGETGRANSIVYKYIDKFSLSCQNTLIYACGHPGMVDDVKAKAKEKEFRVKVEKYWSN
jgi:ferredoxin/flavodoxin---NADP+ reductase